MESVVYMNMRDLILEKMCQVWNLMMMVGTLMTICTLLMISTLVVISGGDYDRGDDQ
jgi:hypothetical protein